MSSIDLTLAVTAHGETVIAGPTMRSAEDAIGQVEAVGFRVELLIGLDSPTDECRSYLRQSRFRHWAALEHSFRDQGQTRNALAVAAQGRWVAFLDADDLFSQNWLALAAKRLAEADRVRERVIVHPEINWVFDGGSFVFTKPPQDDFLFTPHYFYISNYYDTLCMAPRDAFLEVPYAKRDIPNGFAYEDWQWNVETMAAGWRHVTEMNTIVFKRRRDSSQTTQSKERRVSIRQVEPMAIDQIEALGKATKRARNE